jgi:large conductance mechanosensitive channel
MINFERMLMMKKLVNGFRDFIMRGNVVDLAIGVIIGAAFSAVVNSVVNNLLMPPIGLLVGNVNFQDLFIVLKAGEMALPDSATLEMASEAGAVTVNYGLFITDLISFLIIALCVFFIVRGFRSLEEKIQKKAESEDEEAAEPATEKACPFCLKIIAVDATRCPFCTSHLETEGQDE